MTEEVRPDVDYRVSLRSSRTRQLCTFQTTPDLIETRNVNYKMIEPIHAPGQIAAYANTTSRNFNLSSIKLISRTQQEAAENLRKLWLLRSWTMPQFGRSTLSDGQRFDREVLSSSPTVPGTSSRNEQAQIDILGLDIGAERRGSPPHVLLLSAYSAESTRSNNRNATTQHINRVPVVIQNLSIPYPSDVDYIPAAGTGTPMPMIMVLDMTLMETHSPREYERFSLSAFKNGTLPGF